MHRAHGDERVILESVESSNLAYHALFMVSLLIPNTSICSTKKENGLDSFNLQIGSIFEESRISFGAILLNSP